MNKLLIFIIPFLLINCCNKTSIEDSGLNGKVKMLIEYNISVKSDSINNSILDTLSTVKKYYNDLNQIIERNEEYLFVNETMDITYEYNHCNQIQKENVKMSLNRDTMVVNYFYENSLNKKSIAESTIDSLYFKQIGLNKYDINKEIIKSTISQVFVDLKNNDTIKNSVQIDKYNKKGFVKERLFEFFTNLEKNNRTEYFYKGTELISMKKFDNNDSLTSITLYEYKYDHLDNWIEQITFEAGKLKVIKTRSIVYR
ncbi:hypothetical protein PG911_00105 [Tenacibaculum ovolyticum]|uniref:hypothetical protein n=1 Tax=Tenacibaculum ovolyticum TaxID=104270 RepID=UPI0022F38208|nr:hypothetical protein [Tenacibaculum ovolyticum]WBX76694.1 hypothetical protein PG911_00105 [Tenacibaculum ovolyticum]